MMVVQLDGSRKSKKNLLHVRVLHVLLSVYVVKSNNKLDLLHRRFFVHSCVLNTVPWVP